MLTRYTLLALLALILPGPLRAQEPAGADEAWVPTLFVAFFAGLDWPVGAMNVILDPGQTAGARAEYAVSPMTRVGAQLSFHSFDHEAPGTGDNEGAINLSAIGKAIGTWGPYSPYALLGLGAYVTKDQVAGGRRWDGGLQFGAGFELTVSERFAVLVGTGFHMVFRGGENDDYLWLDAYLGFDFRQP